MSNDKTKWIFDDDPNGSFGGENTSRSGDLTETLDNTQGSFGDKTIVGSDEPTVQLDRPISGQDEKTMIYQQFGTEPASKDNADPVAGWLVVVKGPGLGHAANIGSGMNHVGRSATARCSLPFGDNLISSEDHLRVIYDDETRAFFIAPGSGKNISRVNGEILMSNMVLTDGAVINVSKVTAVMFKAFCGPQFDWADLQKAADQHDSDQTDA